MPKALPLFTCVSQSMACASKSPLHAMSIPTSGKLGDDWSQRRISLLEAKEVIEPELLSKVAQALRVPEEAIKNFDEEKGNL